MKKLLVGLLALGSISAFASNLSTEIFDRPCISTNNGQTGTCFHKRSNTNKVCELMTGQAGSIAMSYIVKKRMFGANAITRNGVGYNQDLDVAILKKSGKMRVLTMFRSGGEPVIDSITCTVK